MNIIEIKRFYYYADRTLGVIFVNGASAGFSLELPNRDNKKNISYIPMGVYNFRVYYSKKYKTDCLAVYNVPDRDYISVHYGNYPKDTKGCILVGSNIVKKDLTHSRIALRVIIGSLDSNKGQLIVS